MVGTLSSFLLLLSAAMANSITQLSLMGMEARQSNTWSDRVANLAIDGNISTWSVAASQQDPSLLGWWEVDLGGLFRVSEVAITAASDDYNAKFLQNFTITLFSNSRAESTCSDYPSSTNIPAGDTKSFVCYDKSFQAEYVRICRLGGPFRPDGLALAEVQILVQETSTTPKQATNTPAPVAQDNNGWYRIETKNLTTVQSGTWGGLNSSLAIDNDPSTWSMGCLSCDGSLSSGLGWWQIDLGTERPVMGVELTSSPDGYNAQYLEEFTIGLSSTNSTDPADVRLCYDYNNTTNIQPGTTATFNCSTQPTKGQFLLVIRKTSAAFRPEAIAIAEIQIFEATPTVIQAPLVNNSTNAVTPAPANNTRVFTELPMSGKSARQSNTWSDRVANLAIDGNISTWSVAASQQDPSILGWWEVDLGGLFQVGEVAITAASDDYNSQYLQNFTIQLLSEDRTSAKCADYLASSSFLAAQSMTFTCSSGPFLSRYVRISRLGGPFRPDGLALAEVRVFVSSSSSFIERVFENDVGGYRIPLTGSPVAQSGTWGFLIPQLAIDKNYSTYSVACQTCSGDVTSGLGWWQIDMGTERPIVAVKITSSFNDYDAQYLQDIIIGLSSWNTTNAADSRICTDFSNSSHISPSSVLIFKCNVQPTWGRFLFVERKNSAQFRPDALAIAEIEIFENTPTGPQQLINTITTTPVIKSTTTEEKQIAQSQITAIQSGTLGDNGAQLALDGNPSTSSVALASSTVPYFSQVAWWEADLGAAYSISHIEIKTSLNASYAKSIEGSSVDVYSKSIMEDQHLSGSMQCFYFPEGLELQPGTTFNLRCQQSNYGRFLIIRRVQTTSDSPGILGFAEINIFYK